MKNAGRISRVVISTNDGSCQKKQQYNPAIEDFDDGVILLMVKDYHSRYIENVKGKPIYRRKVQEVLLCIIQVEIMKLLLIRRNQKE